MKQVAAFLAFLIASAMPGMATPSCGGAPDFAGAAADNAKSVLESAWTFTEGRPGAPEGPGWAVYLPLTQATIETACTPDTEIFAARLAGWQKAHALKADGRMTPATAAALTQVWHVARRQVRHRQPNACAQPEESKLVDVSPRDIWGKPEKLIPRAYDAYRRMMEAAHREAPGIFAGNADLKIVSAWRSPERDAERCKDRKCSKVSAAQSCSAHWSGVAVDLNVGYAEGHAPADMDWSNRLFQVNQPAYRWLLANAERFGFANYFAEPWHWEWGGT